MDIVLIKANNQKILYQDLSESLSGIEPPLWLALIAAYLRDKGFSVSILDAEAENLDAKETVERVSAMNPLLAGIVVSGTNPSASTTNMAGASLLLGEFRKSAPGIVTAISGLHVSALPVDTVLKEPVDFVIEGEGFYPYEELIKALRSGKTRQDKLLIGSLWSKYDEGRANYPPSRAKNIEDLDTLPMAAWDLLPMDKYRAHNWHCFDDVSKRQPYGVIYTSLGCPFNCSFCCINTLFGGRGIRYRSMEKVAEEIDYLVKTYGIRNIKILDEIFVLKPQRVFEFCERVIALGHDLNFWVYGRVDTVKEDMLAQMKKAGINWLAYGFEAGNKKVREGVSKGRFDKDQIKDIVKKTHAAGINIVANFIFGLPEDDFDTMQETLDLAKELNCAYANLHCAMAYPGSQLYQDAVDQKVPLPKTWSGYAQFSEDCFPLPTGCLSGGQVLRFRDGAFDDYHNDPKYLKRIEEKFGEKTLAHVKEMCSMKLKRKYYDVDDKTRLKSTVQ